ncbi:MAG: FG-GAP-like repeat-containing protein [Myxococcota bacterium]
MQQDTVARLLLAASVALGTQACGQLEAADEEHADVEVEPDDDGSNILEQGLISCEEHKDTGYSNGNPFQITVVTVDGRPAEVATANAYYVMQQAAAEDGVAIRIVSGFRTHAEQAYLRACYENCNCNSCNLAARPGYSNHQSGHALDLNTREPEVYSWLVNNAARFGFKRTVEGEPWHWEWWGGGPGGGPCGQPRTPYVERVEAALGAHLHDPAGSSDINGDGMADVCGRNSEGITCFLANGHGFGDAVDGPDLSNARGWNRRSQHATLRLADIDGDGDADLCGRHAEGFRCWRSRGDGFGPALETDFMRDDNGWSEAKYYSTIRMADFNGDGKADVCARHKDGFRCWPSHGNGFGHKVEGPAWSDEAGWDDVENHGSIRMGDVNGDGLADVCGRSDTTMVCFLSNGQGFPTRVDGPDWSNEAGWDDANNWSTIRAADVNGDGKVDLCGRSNQAFKCHLSRGTSFGPRIVGPELSNQSHWDGHDNYSTIRLADIDADGDLDLCARATGGFKCWRWTGTDFGQWSVGSGQMTDDGEWDLPRYYRTIRMADVTGDGKADLCGRGWGGVKCWPSLGNDFGAAFHGPEWSDAKGWNAEIYGTTLRLAGF